ncbi:MAG TPA: hypothetical protein VMS64_38160 [Candidatus Methylomirabilis sp.]|nr:hypothetical protein [Candidatus Methylomirabilis sp.]
MIRGFPGARTCPQVIKHGPPILSHAAADEREPASQTSATPLPCSWYHRRGAKSFADPTRDPLWFELFRERPTIVDGFMAVPEAPGLGLELNPDTLEKFGVKLG